MALAPLLLVALAAPLIDLPETYLLLIAMPSGINSMVVTHAYGLDLRISAAGRVVDGDRGGRPHPARFCSPE